MPRQGVISFQLLGVRAGSGPQRSRNNVEIKFGAIVSLVENPQMVPPAYPPRRAEERLLAAVSWRGTRDMVN